VLIGDISRRNARRYPGKTAVIYEDHALSWAALDERANRLATALLARGLQLGDRVAVFARNTAEWPEIVFGLAKAGLVLVPVNVRLTADEAHHIVIDSGSRAAIVHTDHVATFAGVVAACDVVIEIGGWTIAPGYESVLERGRDCDPTPSQLRPDDIQFLLYTSGTTGRPKAVVNEHRAMLAQVLDTTIVTEARHDDVLLAATPFYTAGGMVRTLAWLFLGQTMLIHGRFDPERTLADIERRRVTMTTFIPTMLLRTLQTLESGPARDLTSLRRISYGSASSPVGLARRAMELLGCDLQQRYGLTEAGGQVTLLSPADHRAMVAGAAHLAESCGRETPMAEIRIVDQGGADVAVGEVGEVVITADSVARGYWNRPEETAATFRCNGLWSGDLGRLDERGYLYIVGRKIDMIISGGFNVYPAELERVIGAHPDVDLVAVVGVPDPEWGETPVAVVVAQAGADRSALETDLQQRCRDQLAGFKIPRRFEFRSEMPQTSAGKILKRELRAELVGAPSAAEPPDSP
jgi:acyl-CoA synthetase (AMP-forming)/AMP-acid ligase II